MLVQTDFSGYDVDAILESGRQWNLSEGPAIFPHAMLKYCGDQVAAVVHMCLDSGADRVLALGVVHTFSDIATEQGLLTHPGNEFSLLAFSFLWEEEIRRRGLHHPPQLITRYPSKITLADLEEVPEDCLIVATGDLCHQGVAYHNGILPLGDEGLAYARQAIEKGFALLGEDEELYRVHCQATRSDAADVCLTLHHLLGPFSHEIIDIRLVDTAELYDGHPEPSWVATSLIQLSTMSSG